MSFIASFVFVSLSPLLLVPRGKTVFVNCPGPSCSKHVLLNKLVNVQGPVVQSVVSLTSSLRVISLTVLADSIYNILIFFAEKCE